MRIPVRTMWLLGLALWLSCCNNYDLRDRLENPGGRSTTPPCTLCRIFVSQMTYTGAQIGGLGGADTKCNADPAKPVGKTSYKALLVLGTSRRACLTANCLNGGSNEHIDWVLRPSTQYFQADGITIIAETNANGIWPAPVNLLNPIGDGIIGNGIIWTGLSLAADNEWTTSAANTCGNWDTDASSGMAAAAWLTNNFAIADSSQACDAAPGKSFYCVEQ